MKKVLLPLALAFPMLCGAAFTASAAQPADGLNWTQWMPAGVTNVTKDSYSCRYRRYAMDSNHKLQSQEMFKTYSMQSLFFGRIHAPCPTVPE